MSEAIAESADVSSSADAPSSPETTESMAGVQTGGMLSMAIDHNEGLVESNEAPDERGSDDNIRTEDSIGADEWMWGEDVQGKGDKPKWLKEKYKSVSEQAQAYGELEAKFGEFKGAPKDGYSLDGIDGIDPESPVLKSFQETFKEMNLSQAGFERVLSEYAASQGTLGAIDVKEEMAKLGPQGQDMVNKTNQWLKNNLPEDIVNTVHSWVHTAEDMKALDVLRSFQPLSAAPTAHQMDSSMQYESLKEVKNEKDNNWTRYKEDVNYRKSLSQRMIMAENREKARRRK